MLELNETNTLISGSPSLVSVSDVLSLVSVSEEEASPVPCTDSRAAADDRSR